MFWLIWILIWIISPLLYSNYFVDPMYSLRDWACISATLTIAPFGFVFLKKFRFPVFGVWEKFLTLSIICLLFCLSFFLPSDLSFLAYLLFVVVVGFIVFNQMEKGEHWFFRRLSVIILIATILMLIISYSQLIYSFIDKSFAEQNKNLGVFSVYFGNINIFSQFISLTIPFQLYLWFSKSKPYEKICLISLIGSVTIISFTFCRSAILGSTLSLLLFFLYYRRLKSFFLIVLPYTIFVNLVVSPLITPNYTERSKSKVSTIFIRLALIESGLKASKDFPFGMGLGKYAFNSTPYRYKEPLVMKPDYNERSPHFEPIKWLTEMGVLGLLIAVISISIIFLKLFWKLRTKFKVDDLLITCIILVLSIEALTQFPLEMIHPLTALGICLGYYFHRISGSKHKKATLIICATTFIIGLSISMMHFFSIHNIKQIDRSLPDIQSLGCKYRLVDWRRCLDFSKSILRENPEKSNTILNTLIYNNPFNTFLINEVSFRQRLSGKQKLSCDGAKIQREIYGGFSFFGDSFWQGCDISNPNMEYHVLTYLNSWVKDSDIKIHPIYESALQNY